MFRSLVGRFIAFVRSLRGFAEVHPAVYTFNPQRDSARSYSDPVY
jgi:hypothetical protein